jgi:hypothetical protein
MQLGAYGRVENWAKAFLVTISTNPLIPGIQVHEYSTDQLREGYAAFQHLSQAYDILNGFRTATEV